MEGWLKHLANCTVHEGHARFESASVVQVGDFRLTAPEIFINVGGRASIPEMPGIDQVPYLTNSSMMSVDFLPRHLVIVGGSYIGLEFAQMFRRFGSEVTIIEQNSRLIATGRRRCFRIYQRDSGRRRNSHSAECQMYRAHQARRRDHGPRRVR